MALYALNDDDYISAADASSQISYRCLECKAPVRVKKGRYRLAHFYHLQQSSRCYLYRKSEDHLLLQLQLQKLLAPEAVEIERPFPIIRRIADVVWPKQSLIFEIQCSSIDVDEADKRIFDYQSVGYEVIWLLDDRVFNQRFVRPAERFLRFHLCYFFSFNRIGPSFFYDQLEIIVNRRRHKKGRALPIDPSRPNPMPIAGWPSDSSELLKNRIIRSKNYFYGDLIYQLTQSSSMHSIVLCLKLWKQEEDKLTAARLCPRNFGAFLWHWLAYCYLKILEYLLYRT